MLFFAYILILASVALIVSSIYFYYLPRRPTLPQLKIEDSAITRPIKRPQLFKLLTFMVPLNKRIVNRLGRQKIDDRLGGANVGLLPEDFITLKQLLLAAGIFFAMILKELFPGNEMFLFLGAFVVSMVFPDIWLKLRIGRRQRMIIKALPDTIDLLSLCVNSGLDFSVAVKWVVEKSKSSPLIEELGLLLLETKVGKPRRQALKDMARRTNLNEIHSFARTLIQAERLGTPVESALNILAEEVREMRFQRGERLALQAPIKMLFPLIFFIMPVVGIIVGGPILLQFMQGGLATLK